MKEIKEINREFFIKILHRTCGLKLNFDSIEHFNGPFVEINAKGGFNFVQTGSGYYLTNEGTYLFPFIDYNILLDKASILDYFHKYPYIFQGKKYIIPLVYTKSGNINKRNKIRKLAEQVEISELNF